MGTLRIAYVRGDSILFASDSISVVIDGGPAAEIRDQQHLEFELSSGRHAIMVKGSRCKKTIELDMDGDVSFTIICDRKLGGLTIIENAQEALVRERAGKIFLLGFITVLALHIANCVLNYGKFYSGEVFLTIELACIAALVALVLYLLKIRGRTIVIQSGGTNGMRRQS